MGVGRGILGGCDSWRKGLRPRGKGGRAAKQFGMGCMVTEAEVGD